MSYDKEIKVFEMTPLMVDYAIAKATGQKILKDPMGFGGELNEAGYWIWPDRDPALMIGSTYSPTSDLKRFGQLQLDFSKLVESYSLSVTPLHYGEKMHRIEFKMADGKSFWISETIAQVAFAKVYLMALIGDDKSTVPSDLIHSMEGDYSAQKQDEVVLKAEAEIALAKKEKRAAVNPYRITTFESELFVSVLYQLLNH